MTTRDLSLSLSQYLCPIRFHIVSSLWQRIQDRTKNKNIHKISSLTIDGPSFPWFLHPPNYYSALHHGPPAPCAFLGDKEGARKQIIIYNSVFFTLFHSLPGPGRSRSCFTVPAGFDALFAIACRDPPDNSDGSMPPGPPPPRPSICGSQWFRNTFMASSSRSSIRVP